DHVRAAPARRHRLVGALAAEAEIQRAAEHRLARLRKSIRERGEIDVAAADDDDAGGPTHRGRRARRSAKSAMNRALSMSYWTSTRAAPSAPGHGSSPPIDAP